MIILQYHTCRCPNRNWHQGSSRCIIFTLQTIVPQFTYYCWFILLYMYECSVTARNDASHYRSCWSISQYFRQCVWFVLTNLLDWTVLLIMTNLLNWTVVLICGALQIWKIKCGLPIIEGSSWKCIDVLKRFVKNCSGMYWKNCCLFFNIESWQ